MKNQQKEQNAWWAMSVKDVLAFFKTDEEDGLSDRQVRAALLRYGPNSLPEKKPISPFLLFVKQFYSNIMFALSGAVVISAVLGDYIDVIAITTIIILNAVIGFIQEYSSEKTIRSLSRYLYPMATVIRGGVYQDIPLEQVVPGDIVELAAGDKVPADGRIIYLAHVTVQEAALTGESVPVRKHVEMMNQKQVLPADQCNMLFMGTILLNGTARMIVTATGLATQLGQIAELLQVETEKRTSFEREVIDLEKKLLIGCLIIVITVFAIGLLRGFSFWSLALTSISLAVASIPEGLPVVTTVALAYGLRTMAKKNVVIRRLHAVETLGSTTVICTDKTGTLTENDMKAVSLWVYDRPLTITYSHGGRTVSFADGTEIVYPADTPALDRLLTIAALSSGAEIQRDGSKLSVVGDPTEGATLLIAHQAGYKEYDLEQEHRLITHKPFDSDRKKASYLRIDAHDVGTVYLEGAPETVVAASTDILDNGVVRPITAEDRRKIMDALDVFARQALRVVALGYRSSVDIHASEITDDLEQDLVFVGMIALFDPARPGVERAVALCKRAGIKVAMITGDHEKTAQAIAQHIGLLDEASILLNGSDLDALSDSELERIVDRVAVYARTTAQQKMRIIAALQKTGNTVAMTGDGVNDAPAVKIADIGIAMGKMGTEVTKEASDMVILDDNFASIVSGIEVGRTIYSNIKKFVNYLLSSNLTELFVITSDMLLARVYDGVPYISLLPIHILWINLVTDGFPAIALAIDPVSKKVMSAKPRARGSKIVTHALFIELVSIAIVLALGTLLVSHYSLNYGSLVARTMAFTLLVMLEFVRLYTIRAEHALSFFSNRWLIGSLVASCFCQLAVIYVPFLQPLFKTTALSITQWGILLIATFILFVANRIVVASIHKVVHD